MDVVSNPPGQPNGPDVGSVHEEIARAIARIRYGSVVVQIQDGVVVQIESTEKRRFPAPASSPRTNK
jgi:hypothetical protein